MHSPVIDWHRAVCLLAILALLEELQGAGLSFPLDECITVTETARQALTDHRLSGAWGSTTHSQQASIETTCWAIVALSGADYFARVAEDAVGWLLARQNSDGGWSHSLDFPSDIRTANAAIALSAAGLACPENALVWLFKNQHPTGGWSWNTTSWPFSEPTALAAIALSAAERLPTSVRDNIEGFFLDMQCESGGWNSHAPIMLDIPQDATPDVTAWVLIALKAMGISSDTIFARQGLSYLTDYCRHAWASPTTENCPPYTAAMALHALTAWQTAPDVQHTLVRMLLDSQGRDGLWKDNLLWTAHAIITLTSCCRAVFPSPGGAPLTG